MKKLVICAVAFAAVCANAAVATVRQVEPGVRPVYNSGTGVMPRGSQEAMPRASRQIAKDSRVGVGFSPAMLGFFTPIQVPGPDFDVGGLRLNLLYGTCCNFDGLDIGVVGVADNHANGWLINVVSYARGDGLGLNTGVVNFFGGDFKGFQFGVANWIDSGEVFQAGVYNGARDMQGLQIGVINTAQKMQGVQIGVVNIIANSDVSFFPVVNAWF